MKKYYVMRYDQKYGPFSDEELKQKELSDQVLIWSEDLPDWIMAKTIPELKGFFKVTPPITPYEKMKLTESSALNWAIFDAGFFGILAFLVIFFLLGGFMDDYDLEKLYNVHPKYFETSIRSSIVFPLGLLLAGFPTCLWLFIDYRVRVNSIFKKLLFPE